MNQRRVDCLKRHRRDPELHSEQKGEGHWHSGQVLQWGTHRSVMWRERESMLVTCSTKRRPFISRPLNKGAARSEYDWHFRVLASACKHCKRVPRNFDRFGLRNTTVSVEISLVKGFIAIPRYPVSIRSSWEVLSETPGKGGNHHTIMNGRY
jgi:hypothetical protein